MIWYLLYPFRGTTEPPALKESHPLRRSFTNYGLETSRHPVLTLLTSVAIAGLLIYPLPFIYTNSFINGASNLPHHVWTAAQPIQSNLDVEPDVIMRSVWIHGNHFEALKPDVLQTALEIQDFLLGPTVDFNPRSTLPRPSVIDDDVLLSPEVRDTFHAINGLSDQSWFFQSPLLYFDCDNTKIEQDSDILSTVNNCSERTTSVNVTLRHSIVFAGKRFEDHRLVAADTLVITLIHKLDSPVGRQWERQAAKLSKFGNDRWQTYPRDSQVRSSELYEFKFQPLSVTDDIFLAIAYSITVIYFLLSLAKLRALKSRVGLTITVISQIGISIAASFTICAIFNIDLSKIPREAYPFVVLTVGLENMFRLVNAVIITPSQSTTSTRIASALGQTGHIALAGVGQNLLILWLLYKVVAPGVAAFCVFAAIALTIDFLLLLTFFVAVLSVDVRRTELSDSLNTLSERRKKEGRRDFIPKKTWMKALLRGDTPFSTRVAGTIVMVGFILVLQWHFFDKEHPIRTIFRLFSLFRSKHRLDSSPETLSIDINQARTPTSWLRLQDHETAREVISVVNPGATSYIARVYRPLVIVLAGADRTSTNPGYKILRAVFNFCKKHSTMFFMSIVVAVAAVSLLMNYLLWNEDGRRDDNMSHKEDPLLAVATLAKGHALDIAMLTASPDGVVVSVGLDRHIKVWDLRQETRTHFIGTCNKGVSPFPVLATAIDDQAEWVALLSVSGRIMLWNINDRQWGPSDMVEIKSRTPLSFFFRPTKVADEIAPLVLIRPSGLLTEIDFVVNGQNRIIDLQLCKSPLVCTVQFIDKFTYPNEKPLRIVTASRRGCVHLASQHPDRWVSEDVHLDAPEYDREVKTVLPLPRIGLFLAMRENAVDLVHVKTQGILHTFEKLNMKPNTLECFHSVKRKRHCGLEGLASFSLAYTDRDSGELILQTYLPKQEGDLICIGPKKCTTDLSCNSWTEARLHIYNVRNPGQWRSLPSGSIVGVRKRDFPTVSRPSSSESSSSLSLSITSGTSSIRRRNAPPPRPSSSVREDLEVWEAWVISSKGERHTIPLYSEAEASRMDHQLFVTSCGPMTRVGQRSVALGFGNVIKIITVGHEKFDTVDDASEDVSLAMGRKKRTIKPPAQQTAVTGGSCGMSKKGGSCGM